MSNADICFLRMSTKTKKSTAVLTVSGGQHSAVSAGRRCVWSVFWRSCMRISSGGFSVNWLSLSRFLPRTPFPSLLRGMGGCLEGGSRYGQGVSKPGLAWRPICICFLLPLEMNCCGSCCVRSFSLSSLASPVCRSPSGNLGCLSCDGSSSERQVQRLLWLRLQCSSPGCMRQRI